MMQLGQHVTTDKEEIRRQIKEAAKRDDFPGKPKYVRPTWEVLPIESIKPIRNGICGGGYYLISIDWTTVRGEKTLTRRIKYILTADGRLFILMTPDNALSHCKTVLSQAEHDIRVKVYFQYLCTFKFRISTLLFNTLGPYYLVSLYNSKGRLNAVCRVYLDGKVFRVMDRNHEEEVKPMDALVT